MRCRFILILLAVPVSAAVPAFAQVTVDLKALEALPHRAPAPPVRRPASPPLHSSQVPATRAERTAPAAAAQAPAAPPDTTPRTPPPAAGPAPPPATIGQAPPEVATLTPVAPPPAPQNPAPPPAPPIAAGASTTATPTTAGLRLTFVTGQSDLSPGSAQQIKAFVDAAPKSDAVTFNVLAYAAGVPDDPSDARRLSLARAIAVRSALLADGVSSSRVYLRALGSAATDGPADRVDLSLLGSSGNTDAVSK